MVAHGTLSVHDLKIVPWRNTAAALEYGGIVDESILILGKILIHRVQRSQRQIALPIGTTHNRATPVVHHGSQLRILLF